MMLKGELSIMEIYTYLCDQNIDFRVKIVANRDVGLIITKVNSEWVP